MAKGVPLLVKMCSAEGIEAEILALILHKANLALSVPLNQNCKRKKGFFNSLVK